MSGTRIVIVGAGITGLAAAVALADQRHEITVLERSTFVKKTQGFLHIAPYLLRILKELGIDCESLRTQTCREWQYLPHSSELYGTNINQLQLSTGGPEDQRHVHRSDLYKLLLEAAERSPNIKLIAASVVESIDPNGLVYAGKTFRADVIIAADGLESLAISTIDADSTIQPATHCSYEFTTESEVVWKSELRKCADSTIESGVHNVLVGPREQRLDLYPSHEDKLLCFAIEARNAPTANHTTGHSSLSSTRDLRDVLSEWPDEFQVLSQTAKITGIFQFSTRSPMKSYVKNRLVLIGNAACPILPVNGMAMGCGIEDAAVLAVFLERLMRPSEVPFRLRMYNVLRHKRMESLKRTAETMRDLAPSSHDGDPSTGLSNTNVQETVEDRPEQIWEYDAVKEARRVVSASRFSC